MPAPAPSANRFRNLTIGQQAERRMMLIVRCNLCHRIARFWGADLARVLGPDHQAHVPPFPCARCGTADYLDIRWNLPSARELQEGLTVRRPVRQIVKWIWRDEKA